MTHLDWKEQHPKLFEQMTGIISGLIGEDHYNLSLNPENTARLVVSNLAHKYSFIWLDHDADSEYDWTVSRDGRANSSPHYYGCVRRVEETMREELLALLTHNAPVREQVAQKILVMLADERRVIPEIKD